MKRYRHILAVVSAFAAVTVSALAAPVYYTILHALDEDTMAVFTDGGSGSLSLSSDGGETFKNISSFSFDRYGRAFARVYDLNRAAPESLVKLTATFNESERGKPLDVVVESSVTEFFDALTPYSRWSWLTYAPVYVSYSTLPDIVDTAIMTGGFTKLVAAVQTAGLESALRSPGPFTVFAPTDDAFAALGLSDEDLLSLPNLGEILTYHVIPDALNGDAVAAETHLETLLGKDVDVSVLNGELFINDSKVVLGNVEAANGIIHVIDTVLFPPTLPNIVEIAATDDRFEVLTAALRGTGLDAALTNEGPFTVFAPTDDAFALLLDELGLSPEQLLADEGLADILAYHVVEGRLKADDVAVVDRLTTLLGRDVKISVTEDGVSINESKVVLANIKAENGIIHVIDAVLIPEEKPSIVEIALNDGRFDILVGALAAVELDAVLESEGPFTVFAPTDAAFEKLPKWLFNWLVNNPRYLKAILLYHVVAEDLQAEDVIQSGYIKTVSGRYIKPRVNRADIFINQAKVIDADIDAGNGTIHVIDSVLIPWFGYR